MRRSAGCYRYASWVCRSMTARRGAVASDFIVGLEPIDDFIQSLLLNFRPKVSAETLDVRDALDDHVPGLPPSVGFPQTEIHRDFVPVGTLLFGSNRGHCIIGVALVRQYHEAIGREIDQRRAVIAQQRMIERVDEALALL